MQRVSRSRFCDIALCSQECGQERKEGARCTARSRRPPIVHRGEVNFPRKLNTFGEVVCLQEIYFMADDYIYSIFFNKFVEAYSVALKYDLGVSPGFTRKINFLYQSRAVFKMPNSFITGLPFMTSAFEGYPKS